MTDTPAESAEDPRTPEEWAEHALVAMTAPDVMPSEAIAGSIRAALAARDAELLAKLEGWRREHRYEGPFNPEDIYEELRALLSEGKPGK